MECSKISKCNKEILSFSTAIVLTITIIMIGSVITNFLSGSINFILFFASPFLLIFSIYIAYRLTKILNNRFTCLQIIFLNSSIIVLIASNLWMQENFYPRGNDSADDMCGTSHISEIYSPDKTRKAISYSYDCGATTGFNTKITLAAANQSLADTPKSADVYGVDKEGVTITWIDNKKLLIQHSPFHRVFHFKHEYNEINVYSNSKINPSKP